MISHGVGFLGCLVAAPVLIVTATSRGEFSHIIGSTVFAISMALLYLASTLYHATPVGPRKAWYRRLDHAAIYLLIAGTYTPFTIGVLSGAWGWTLLVLVWSMAVVGVYVKVSAAVRSSWLSVILYIAMGWLALIAIRPIMDSLPPHGLYWLLAGGVFYTGGVVFYVATRMPYHHFYWHLCVLTGTLCHFFAVLWHSA